MNVATPIVDWIQFTMPVSAGIGCQMPLYAGNPADQIFALLTSWGIPADVANVLTPPLKATGASAPYNQGGASNNGINWYWHDTSGNVDTFLCQISGQGCAALRGAGMLEDVIRWTHQRISRIDVACDVETTAALEDLFSTTKRLSYINSKSGQTFYVGSMKSDKYARVYRYSAPHPRAAYARFECVYRRKFASEAARAVLERGVSQAWADMIASNRITLSPSLAARVASGERLRVMPPTNNGGEGTLRWLITTVAPSMRRMMLEQGFDVDDFIREYVKGR